MKNNAAPIHAILGTDDFEVKRVARELAAELAPPGDFGQEIISGHAANADDAAQKIFQTIEALNTFGFFGGAKLVWLKDANFFADDRTGGAEATLDAMEKFTALLQRGLPDGTRLIISGGAIDKRRTFYKTLGKIAEVQFFERVDSSKQGWERGAMALCRELARPQRLEFDEDALELFTLYTGGDRYAITSELEKLDLFLGQTTRRVTQDEVRTLTPMSRAGVIFELGNAIASRQLPRAQELLAQLMFHGEKAIGILLATIIPTVRNLLLAKDLLVRHKLSAPANPFQFGTTLERLPAAATAHLPRTKEGKLNVFALGFAAAGARNFTLPELQSGLKACLAANIALVTSPTETEVVLGQLLVRLTGGKIRTAAAR